LKTAIAGGGAQLLNIGQEIVNRAIGAPGFVATLGGIKVRKRLCVYAFILSEPAGDGRGRPLATESKVREALLVADEIFKREANTELFWGDWPEIHTIEEPAPAHALDVECGTGSWRNDLGDAGAYFRSKLSVARKGVAWRARIATGYGEPIAVFVVRDVAGKAGCSLGPLSDYVTVDRVRGKLIAHELAHSCGLWHTHEAGNLMLHTANAETMTRSQRAIFRNSRHVTFV
jgi:hypothetical protein